MGVRAMKGDNKMAKNTETKTKSTEKDVDVKPNRSQRRKTYRGKRSRTNYDKDAKRAGANDISWYATDATLLRNASNLPWSTQTGISYIRDLSWKKDDGTVTSDHMTDTVPGFMVAYLSLGPGRTEADIDAVNISGNAIYTFVRHMNSGGKNYDAPQMMSYLLSMDEVFAYINWLQRLYGTIAAYNVFNRYTPEALIKAQGVDYNDLRDNMVTFKYRINLAIKQAATLVVPNTMPLYFRHSWLFQNYYIEGTDIKDQIYFYSPVNFRRLDPTTGDLIKHTLWQTTSGAIRPFIPDLANSGEYLTVQTLCDTLDDMLRVLYTNEDTGIMAGDILKAYGEGNILRLSELPDAYVTPIIPNNEVLLQFKNSTSGLNLENIVLDAAEYAGGTFDNIICDPNTNKIYWNLSTTGTTAASDLFGAISRDNVLTLEGDPSPEMNMIMTRLMSYCRLNGGDTSESTYSFFCGTEIVVAYRACYDPDPYSVIKVHTIMDSSTPGTIAARSGVLANFKYHPRIIQVPNVTIETTNALPNFVMPMFQVDNFTYIESDILDRLHQVAIMSELAVPHMALMK